MNILLFLKALQAIFEVIFLCLAIYYFIRGMKTKSFGKTRIFFFLYIVLNVIRKIVW